jgi:hypothetical protein
MNGLKVEDDVKIKTDPDSSSPAALLDDDEYEDTGELQFPKEIPTGWLTRIPADLWKSLEKLNDDDEILIGEIKVWNQPDNKTKVCFYRWKIYWVTANGSLLDSTDPQQEPRRIRHDTKGV